MMPAFLPLLRIALCSFHLTYRPYVRKLFITFFSFRQICFFAFDKNLEEVQQPFLVQIRLLRQ